MVFRRHLIVIVPALFLFLAVAGCQTTKPVGDQGPADAAKPVPPEPLPVSAVTLGPGDGIDIKFFHTPELNDSQTVRPDGKITLQLVGEVTAQGKTPEELRSELIKLYTPELRNPEVAVIVRSLSDRRVYVGGEVNKPGIVPMPGRLTALEAIVEAGGFKMETAKVKSVVVIHQREGKFHGSLLDFRAALKGEGSQPFYLEPRDIIYVSQTAIVEVDQWVDQYIFKLLPVRNVGFGISY